MSTAYGISCFTLEIVLDRIIYFFWPTRNYKLNVLYFSSIDFYDVFADVFNPVDKFS